MNFARPCLRCLIVLAWLLAAASAWADGILTHMSGPVSVRKVDGSTQSGRSGLNVMVGDTVITGSGGYVRMEMSDGGELVLRPDSQLKVESYAFVQAKPAEDNFVFSMLKGGLRTVTGLIGKRGNRDAYEVRTATATIGIRGTQYDMRVCQANCGALADGTYLAVRFGAIQASNAQGTLAVAAGQVAFVPPQRPPVMLPRDPGIGFTPPAVIPKLDEKKKVQAAATTAATTPEQAKPASTGSSAPTQQGAKATGGSSDANSTDSGVKKESSGSATNSVSKTVAGSEASGNETTQGTPGTAAGVTGTPSSALTQQSSSASPGPSGVECSVQ
jgi:hypothetical protein